MFERIGIALQQMLAMFVYPIHYTLDDYLYYLKSAYIISLQKLHNVGKGDFVITN